MQTEKFALTTIGYTASTFTLAILWHLILFKDTYETIGYIGREEPGLLLGLLSIITQALVLSYLYPLFQNGTRFLIAMGIFHWSMHVVAAAAKNQIADVPLFFSIETSYLIIQFALALFLFRFIYRTS